MDLTKDDILKYLKSTRLTPDEYNALSVSLQETYPMEGKKKKAIIFSNVEFQNDTENKRSRRGGAKDAESICTTLKELNFEVKLYINRCYNEIHEKLLKLSKKDHKNTGCLLVVAMTHGTGDKLEAFDTTYSVDTLWKMFISNCTALNGIPKLFFIQACRGENYDTGVSVLNLEKETGSESNEQSAEIVNQDPGPKEEPQAKMIRTELIGKSLENQLTNQPSTNEVLQKVKIGCQKETQTEDMVISNTDSLPMRRLPRKALMSLKVLIPTTPDLLVMYSSNDGFPSSRHPNDGSCFIQSLCAELKANGDKQELLQMLTSVSRMVAYHFKYAYQTKDFSEKIISKQMTCFESTLTKQLYLA